MVSIVPSIVWLLSRETFPTMPCHTNHEDSIKLTASYSCARATTTPIIRSRLRIDPSAVPEGNGTCYEPHKFGCRQSAGQKNICFRQGFWAGCEPRRCLGILGRKCTRVYSRVQCFCPGLWPVRCGKIIHYGNFWP